MVEPTLSWNRFLEVQRRCLNSTSMIYIKFGFFWYYWGDFYPFLYAGIKVFEYIFANHEKQN